MDGKKDVMLKQNQFLQSMFTNSLDGKSSNRIVEKLHNTIA